MSLSPRTVSLLKLSLHEKRVLSVLEKGAGSISSLSRLTRFPRTTLYTAISSLKDRGLINKKIEGRSVIISAIHNDKISNLFSEGITAFSPEGNIRIANVDKAGHNSGFTMIYGKKAMLEVWKGLTDKKQQRVYVIQPTKSLLNTIKLFKPGEFVPINNAIKKNKIIIDTVMREDGFSAYMKVHEGQRHIQKKIIKSFIGRSADIAKVGDEYLNNNAELIITSNYVFIMNWENEVGLKIENKDMIDFLKELYLLAKGYGKKIDFNEYMMEWEKKIA